MLGTPLFCPHCGVHQLKPDARFCHHCGRRIPPSVPQTTGSRGRRAPRGRSHGGIVALVVLLLVLVAAAAAWSLPASHAFLEARLGQLPGPPLPGHRTTATPARSIVVTVVVPRPTASPPATARPLTETPVPSRAPAAGVATVAPPLPTPQPTVTPVDTATPWSIDTPAPTARLMPSPAPTTAPTAAVGRVVFVSDRQGYAHINLIDGKGRGLRAVTGGNEYFWDPVLSDDGSRLAYVSKVSGNTEIFVAAGDGSHPRAVSNHAAEDDHPSFFPGGRELAFASRRDGPWEIYRMASDGSNVRRLTAGGGDNRWTAVSPDGNSIAYVSLGGPAPQVQLMVMSADGSGSRAVLAFNSSKQRNDPGRNIFRPDWSPDGAWLAFGADDRNTATISVVLVSLATGESRRLIEDGNSPAWSPDGAKLIYKPGGERQILFVADTAGHRLYQLTDSGFNAWSPDWAQ